MKLKKAPGKILCMVIALAMIAVSPAQISLAGEVTVDINDPITDINTEVENNDVPQIRVLVDSDIVEDNIDTDLSVLDGSGTSVDPFQIKTVSDLKVIDSLIGSKKNMKLHYFKLMNDIDLSSEYGREKGSWKPLGDADHPFKGLFEGNNHTISGLYIESDESHRGLFAASSGYIYNLHVKGQVTGGRKSGGIVGENFGFIGNCTFDGVFSGNNEYCGGIVGYNQGKVVYCINKATINAGGRQTGGVVGRAEMGKVTNCENRGEIFGNNKYFIGGVAGLLQNGEFENNRNYGNIHDGNYVGGVIGQALNSVSNLQNFGDVSGKENVAGIVGEVEYNSTISYCENHGTITGSYTVGGICGDASYGTVSYCKNFGSVDASIVSAGGIVGETNGTLRTSINYGKVTGYAQSGGVAGKSFSLLEYCANYGMVEGSGNFRIAGIVGDANYGTTQYCCNMGEVYGNESTAGIAGFMYKCTVQYCYNAGNIIADKCDKPSAGGIAGVTWLATIKDCYNTGYIKGINRVGGITGEHDDSWMSNTYNYGVVKGEKGQERIGSIIGYRSSESHKMEDYPISRTYYCEYYDDCPTGYGGWDKTTYNSAEVTDLTEAEMCDTQNFIDWNFENVWYMTKDGPHLRNMCEGIENGEVHVKSAKDLVKISENSVCFSYKDITVKLDCDIDLEEIKNDLEETKKWTPIANESLCGDSVFAGTFDGNGHSITGLNVDRKENFNGLFGKVSGKIMNLKVSGKVTGENATGGIVGHLMEKGVIENCSFNGIVSGKTCVGGIVGYANEGSSIKNCSCHADVTGSSNTDDLDYTDVGGIAGSLLHNAKIENCTFCGGTISAGNGTYGSATGGIAGRIYINSLVKNCIHMGDIDCRTGSCIGGIVGCNEGGEGLVENCCHYVGKIIGNNGFSAVYSGYIGGIVGKTAYSYHLGSGSMYGVSGSYYLTGTVMDSEGNSLENAIGEKYDPLGIGVPDITDHNPAGLASPLTAEQFISKESFVGWDFDSVWEMAVNHPVISGSGKVIKFNANGGEGSMDDYSVYTLCEELPESKFTREGYEFLGWNTEPDASGTYYADESTVPFESMTLYAVWAVREDVEYIDENGDLQTESDSIGLNPNIVKVYDGNVFVDGEVKYSKRLEISGEVNIILKDGAVLNVPKGIHVPEGSTLNIFGQSDKYQVPDTEMETQGTGQITAGNYTDEEGLEHKSHAAIGGNYTENGGVLNFYGGRIESRSSYGASIGGGMGRSAESILFKNCYADAASELGAAAIGGGCAGNGCNVEIIDSYVSAKGGVGFQLGRVKYASSGIGAGAPYEMLDGELLQVYSKPVTIHNSIVHAKAGEVTGENDWHAGAIGTSWSNNFDNSLINSLSEVRAEINGVPVELKKLPHYITSPVIDFVPCHIHRGCDDDLEKCCYCGSKRSDIYFIKCEYNFLNAPAPFSYGVESGNSIKITSNVLSKDNGNFLCWNTEADGSGDSYRSGDTITPTQNMTLYAQWGETPVYEPKQTEVPKTTEVPTITEAPKNTEEPEFTKKPEMEIIIAPIAEDPMPSATGTNGEGESKTSMIPASSEAAPKETATIAPAATATPDNEASIAPAATATPESEATIAPAATATPESEATIAPAATATPDNEASIAPTASAKSESVATDAPKATAKAESVTTDAPKATTKAESVVTDSPKVTEKPADKTTAPVPTDKTAPAKESQKPDQPVVVNNPDGSTTTIITTSENGTETVDKLTVRPDGTTEKVTEEKRPDGTVATTTVTTIPNGAQTTETVTTVPDGTQTSEKLIVESDGTKTTEKQIVNPDGSQTSEKLTVKPDGTQTSEKLIVDSDGNTEKTSEVISPSGDYTKVTKKTTVKKDASGVEKPTSIKINVEKKIGNAVTTMTFDVLNVGGTTGKSKTKNAKNSTGKNAQSVALEKASTNDKSGKITIPANVSSDEIVYNIKAIKAKAFKGGKTKIKKILLEASGITSIAKKAFDGINKKAVITVKANKKQFKRIKKLVKKSGVNKHTKIKRQSK